MDALGAVILFEDLPWNSPRNILIFPPSTVFACASSTMSSMQAQARKEEILAKKAKLAELKRQRELRENQFSTNRLSLDASEVGIHALPNGLEHTPSINEYCSSWLRPRPLA